MTAKGMITRTRCFGIVLLGTLLITGLTSVRAGDGGVSMSGPSTFPQQDGAALFQAICQGCHMPNAEGAIGAGAYPPLAHNKKLASALYPIYVVVKGRKDMPPLASYLSDAQIAMVVTYVRTHFGNHYADAISPEMVKAAREGH
jgi:mono/diheme cytochrome c family protein